MDSRAANVRTQRLAIEFETIKAAVLATIAVSGPVEINALMHAAGDALSGARTRRAVEELLDAGRIVAVHGEVTHTIGTMGGGMIRRTYRTTLYTAAPAARRTPRRA